MCIKRPLGEIKVEEMSSVRKTCPRSASAAQCRSVLKRKEKKEGLLKGQESGYPCIADGKDEPVDDDVAASPPSDVEVTLRVTYSPEWTFCLFLKRQRHTAEQRASTVGARGGDAAAEVTGVEADTSGRWGGAVNRVLLALLPISGSIVSIDPTFLHSLDVATV